MPGNELSNEYRPCGSVLTPPSCAASYTPSGFASHAYTRAPTSGRQSSARTTPLTRKPSPIFGRGEGTATRAGERPAVGAQAAVGDGDATPGAEQAAARSTTRARRMSPLPPGRAVGSLTLGLLHHPEVGLQR